MYMMQKVVPASNCLKSSFFAKNGINVVIPTTDKHIEQASNNLA